MLQLFIEYCQKNVQQKKKEKEKERLFKETG